MDEKSLREALLAGAESGQLPQIISSLFSTVQDEGDELARELAALHNEGQVDVVSALETLNNIASNEPKSILISYPVELVFSKTLPHLNEPVASVMRCILGFRSATRLENAFIDFCKKDAARPREALKLIESDHGSLVNMLVATFVAGSQIDSHYYLTELLRFIRHSDLEVRRRAVLALTWFRWPMETSVPNSAITALEETAIKESDDLILANTIKSAFALFEQDNTLDERTFVLIDMVLTKGDEHTLHSASELLGFSTQKLSSELLQSLIAHLKRVKPENLSTLNNIDYGIANLLKRDDPEQGLRFLEELLSMHGETLKIETLDSAVAKIRERPTLISKVLTRWFLLGAPALCRAANEIAGSHYVNNIHVEVDEAELHPVDHIHILFIARKAIGYLFINPVTAASIVTSLMRYAPDDETLNALGRLLFDPLLINYPGSVLDYLEERSKHESDNVKETIETAIASIKHYQEILRAVPELPALHASQLHREIYRRRMSESMAVSMRAAEKKSFFSGLFTRSTLLYGNKSINYFYSGNGKPHRTEMPLTSHSISIELPRMNDIDPSGIDYILRVFRQEPFAT